jgi:uncharacterized protein
MLERSSVESPCNQICEIDQGSGFCKGCLRTLDEIAEWPDASDRRRLAIVDALARRLNSQG